MKKGGRDRGPDQGREERKRRRRRRERARANHNWPDSGRCVVLLLGGTCVCLGGGVQDDGGKCGGQRLLYHRNCAALH